ncbi:MAG: FAD:protein FMN transferase [Candidatus Rariloculaceae bacterium]
MATWVDLYIRGIDSASSAAAIAATEDLLRRYERDYYAWTPGELADINAAIRRGEASLVSEAMADLLTEAQRLSERSDGLFEAGLGRLVELWGFHSSTETRQQPPDPDEIEALLGPGSRIASIRIDNLRVTSQSPGLILDLGGIAKGAAVDAVISELRERRIENALVNAGGDLRVIGYAGGETGERSWRVGIRHPRKQELLGVLELADGDAAFTSGDYERFYDHDGARAHHILDPRTGYPVAHTQAVTVVATNGTLADVAATTLFVAGPDRWRELARSLDIEAVMRVDASGEVELTEAMRERLTQANGGDSDIMTEPAQD